MTGFSRLLGSLLLASSLAAVKLDHREFEVSSCGDLHKTLGWCYGENRYGASYGITILADLVCNQKTHATINPYSNITIRSSAGAQYSISPDPTFTGDALFAIEQAAYLYLSSVVLSGRETATAKVHYGIRGVTLVRESTDYEYGYLFVENSIFRDFSDDQSGAAIYSNGGEITIAGSTFQNNVAHNAAGTADGGAIFSGGSNVVVTDSTFAGNVADRRGGAVAVNGSDVAVTGSKNWDKYEISGTFTCTGCSFTQNTAGPSNPAALGGAVYGAASTKITITGGTFTGNSAGLGKGASVYTEGVSNLYIKDSTLSQNTASDGDVSLKTGTLTLDGTTISNFTLTNGTNLSGCDGVDFTGTAVIVVTKGNNALDSSCGTLQEEIKEAKNPKGPTGNGDDDGSGGGGSGAGDDDGLGEPTGTSGSSGGKDTVALGMSMGSLVGVIIGLAVAAVVLALCGRSMYRNRQESRRAAAIAAKANAPLPPTASVVVVPLHGV